MARKYPKVAKKAESALPDLNLRGKTTMGFELERSH